jgi:hypothetical protein
MEKSSVRESHNDSAGQEVPSFLWNMSIHYPYHKNQLKTFLTASILSLLYMREVPGRSMLFWFWFQVACLLLIY